jgi:two-component system, NarL family, nitrate/nitrite response regulator NarL
MGPRDDYLSGISRAAARVLVAAATTLYRDGVLAAFTDDTRFIVVGSAQDEREFVWRVVAERPDVALLDVDLLRALAARGLLGSLKGSRLIVLAMTDRDDDIATCAQAGAAEVLRRHADRAELMAAVDRAVNGEGRFTSLRSALLESSPPSAPPPAASTKALTTREREILALIEAGRTNKAIALELGCSISTVKNHVHTLLSKLGVTRRTEAARVARDLLPAAD